MTLGRSIVDYFRDFGVAHLFGSDDVLIVIPVAESPWLGKRTTHFQVAIATLGTPSLKEKLVNNK